MSFEKVAVVTGGNKGIGYAVVKALCKKFDGAVFLTSRDVTRGKEAVAALNKDGFHPKYHQLEVDDDKSISAFASFIQKNYEGIDILVNNAAIAFKQDSTETFGVQAEETLRVNYFALVSTCEQLFPLLKPQARVVNVSSSVGHLSKIPSVSLRKCLSDPQLTVKTLSELMSQFVEAANRGNHASLGWPNSAYAVSKVGVSALTQVQQRQLNLERAQYNIVVNSVHPGYVDTDMTSHKGQLTPDRGAEAPVYCALLPTEGDIPRGAYIWHDCKCVPWDADTLTSAF